MEAIKTKVNEVVQSIKQAPVKTALIIGGVVITGIVVTVVVKNKFGVGTEVWDKLEPVVEEVAAVVEA